MSLFVLNSATHAVSFTQSVDSVNYILIHVSFSLKITYLLNPLCVCPHIRASPVNTVVACPSLVSPSLSSSILSPSSPIQLHLYK